MKFASVSLTAAILSKSAANAQILSNHRLGASANDWRELQLEPSSMSVALLVFNSESEQNGGGGGPGPSPVSKNAKKAKSAKSSKSIKCEQDDFLVARYGKQLCPSEVEAKYTKLENTKVETRGLQNFLQPNFSVPLIDTFTTYGQVEMTRAQIESICTTKCENDPNCGAVFVQSNAPPPGDEDYTGKTRHVCIMVNPELGPGAYLQDRPDSASTTSATFLKKSSTPLPRFELVQCNINGTQLTEAVTCEYGRLTNTTLVSNTTVCETLLTEDWNTYMTPAVDCLGPSNLLPCLGCILKVSGGVEDVCPTDANTNTTIILDPKKCGLVCKPDQCADKVETGTLCATGVYRGSFSGFVNRPESSDGHFEAFTCPPV